MQRTFLLLLLALVSAAQLIQAQDMKMTQPSTSVVTTQNYSTADPGGGPKLVRLAGCLERGPTAGEYSLMGQNLSWWELKSESVNLESHIEQDVRITAFDSSDGIFVVVDLMIDSPSCTYR